MKTHDTHGTKIRFWGGPDDGDVIEDAVEYRFTPPVEWLNPVTHTGYRVLAIVRHRDGSICSTTYAWREVWEQ